MTAATHTRSLAAVTDRAQDVRCMPHKGICIPRTECGSGSGIQLDLQVQLIPSMLGERRNLRMPVVRGKLLNQPTHRL